MYTYDDSIVSKIEKEFIVYQADNSHFTVTNLLDLLVAFDRLSSVSNMQKLL